MKDDYCSVAELAEELGCDRATLHSRIEYDIAHGQNLDNLNGIQCGNRIKFSRTWLWEKKGIDLRKDRKEEDMKLKEALVIVWNALCDLLIKLHMAEEVK